MPRVSVLMPIWNTRDDHLREAIESILNQTYEDFEFLILNDSPDNTALGDIVASYADERILYTVNEKNLGISRSRNRLLKAARGEYVAIFDHDDISEPERLQRQVEYLDANPEVGVLGVGMREYSSGKIVIQPENDTEIRLGLMWGCMVSHSAAMVRRDLLERHGICYEERFTPSEDYALWCRLIPHTRFHNLPDVLFNYRVHASNTSKRMEEQMTVATYAVRAFAATDNPELYNEYLMRAEHVTRVRLFGFLPLLKIVRSGIRIKVYLFDHILLYAAKKVIKMPSKG